MNVKGKVIKLIPAESGVNDKGNWIRGGFVIDTYGSYICKISFTAFGKRYEEMPVLNPGDEVDVNFHINASEYNGKWYNNCNIDNVTKI